MHSLSPETDNCPSWISGRERMTVENISWSISTKNCCRPLQGLNPQPPGLQSDGASNWATEADGRLVDPVKNANVTSVRSGLYCLPLIQQFLINQQVVILTGLYLIMTWVGIRKFFFYFSTKCMLCVLIRSCSWRNKNQRPMANAHLSELL